MTAQENERWNFYIHRERQLFGGAHKHLNVKSKLAARAGAALNLDGAASQVTSAWLDEMDKCQGASGEDPFALSFYKKMVNRANTAEGICKSETERANMAEEKVKLLSLENEALKKFGVAKTGQEIVGVEVKLRSGNKLDVPLSQMQTTKQTHQSSPRARHRRTLDPELLVLSSSSSSAVGEQKINDNDIYIRPSPTSITPLAESSELTVGPSGGKQFFDPFDDQQFDDMHNAQLLLGLTHSPLPSSSYPGNYTGKLPQPNYQIGSNLLENLLKENSLSLSCSPQNSPSSHEHFKAWMKCLVETPPPKRHPNNASLAEQEDHDNTNYAFETPPTISPSLNAPNAPVCFGS